MNTRSKVLIVTGLASAAAALVFANDRLGRWEDKQHETYYGVARDAEEATCKLAGFPRSTWLEIDVGHYPQSHHKEQVFYCGAGPHGRVLLRFDPPACNTQELQNSFGGIKRCEDLSKAGTVAAR